jgi:cytochrome c551/c552
MNQIKYLVYACLIICTCYITSIFLHSLLSNDIFAPQPNIHYDQPDQKTQPSVASKGQNLFQQNCRSCHALDKNLTGPALRGVEERGPWNDRENLLRWVKNPALFIPTTPYTKELQKQYVVIMPSFPQLSDEDIHAIFDFIIKAPSVAAPIAMK